MTRASRDEELFDEGRLRRALRLEPSELPGRFDAAAIAAHAGAARPGGRLASLASAAVAGAAAAVLGLVATVTVFQIAPAVANDLLSALIEQVTSLLIATEAAVRPLQEPTLPITALVALAVAIVYEYAQRRERANVTHAS